MSNFKKILNSIKEYDADTIFEMANVSEKYHKLGINIKLNVIQPTDKKIKHGPRVKCFNNSSSKNFSISLDEDPTKMKLMAGDYKDLIDTKEFNILLNYLKKYRIPYLNLWYNWKLDVDDLMNQIDQIDRGFEVELEKPKPEQYYKVKK